MSNITSLQAAIEKRAAEKLDKDLRDVQKLVRSNPILGRHNDDFPKVKMLKTPAVAGLGVDARPAVWEETNLFWLFRYEDGSSGFKSSTFMDRLREVLLPEYIERETSELLQQIDTLKENVGYLLDHPKLQE